MRNEGSIFEGRTLDDAVRKGLEALGRSRAEVMITIIEEGSGGFLGLGARPYKVRVMPRPGGAMREPERESGRVAGRGGRGRGESGRVREGRGRGEVAARGREGRGRGEPGGGRRERGERSDRSERVRPMSAEGAPRGREGRIRSEGRGEGRREARPMRGAPPMREPELEPSREPRERFEPPREPSSDAAREPGLEADREERTGAASEGRRRRRGRRGRGGGEPRPGRGEGARPAGAPAEEHGEAPPHAAEPMMPVAPEFEREEMESSMVPAPYAARELRAPEPPQLLETPETGPAMSSDELAATGKRIAEELFAAMGFEATVTAHAEADHVDVTAGIASGEDLLTGRKGEVRQALQHLLNRILNRGEGSRYHLQLEINEFWKRREDELRAIAHELAKEALESQGEAVTEYLNAQERRIVHVALKEDPRVKTYALGTGLIKRVAIAPADYPEGPRQD